MLGVKHSAMVGAVIVGLLCPTTSFAQITTPADSTKDGMQLSSEKDVGYGAETSFLTWHGYLSLEGHKKQDTVGTFDLHEFYLSAKAQISQRVSVTAEFEYEHGAEVLVLPMQAYVDYVVDPRLVVRGGMFFSPIGIPRTAPVEPTTGRMWTIVIIAVEFWTLLAPR